MYTHQVNFEKQYVSGALSGHRYTGEYIRFCDAKSARAFAKKCDGKTLVKDCVGLGEFIQSDALISELE